MAKGDEDGNQNIITILYKTNLVDNFAEGIFKMKCKDFDCFLKYESIKDNLIKYKF